MEHVVGRRFPAAEFDAEENRWVSRHHPFTSPAEEDLGIWKASGRVRAQAYDLVLNGTEIGGGSIRIHRSDVQAQDFQGPGLHARTEARDKFGFFLEALEFGTPPHGGIALGWIAS